MKLEIVQFQYIVYLVAYNNNPPTLPGTLVQNKSNEKFEISVENETIAL